MPTTTGIPPIRAAAALGFTITVDGLAPADPEGGATWNEVSEDARGLVMECWPAISAVAAALMDSRPCPEGAGNREIPDPGPWPAGV
ncbi:hypothetical protein [Streptomyces sp. SID8499]|uniref:hypothetical protein n=1 Tax=Streptomyces sp. SID8499 TaxID=2706106 RepID=UPI0013CCFD45|nr:hypothetical protein [Streptomyces sp. SID8499]NED37788.1 hypothetical protein [Streptomyces sp. SID8499]